MRGDVVDLSGAAEDHGRTLMDVGGLHVEHALARRDE
jgi:hypothetical protein